MSLQEIVYRGQVISTGAAQSIAVNAGFDTFTLRNLTTLAAGAGITECDWYLGMADGTAETKTLAAGTLTDAIITSGGFTYVDASTANLGPAIVVSGITKANPAVASTGTTPLVGQIVRVYGTTGMLQIAGMDFTVTAVNPGVSMSFGYLSAGGFAAAATAGSYRLVSVDGSNYPRNRYITAITKATQAVVTFSVTHGYVVGEKLSFRVPAEFGMIQMDKLTGTVLAINTTNNTVTLDIDSSAFTTFAFPTSALAATGISFAQAVPAGEIATILTAANRNSLTRSILVGSSICGTSGDVLEFWASRSET